MISYCTIGNTTGANQTSRETEESTSLHTKQYKNICILVGTFRAVVAYRAMLECTEKIKKVLRFDSLADKLVQKRIINEKEKNEIIDQSCGLTADKRMDKLLSIVKASIEEDGKEFELFIEIIKQEDTTRADRLAQTLLDTYKRVLNYQ